MALAILLAGCAADHERIAETRTIYTLEELGERTQAGFRDIDAADEAQAGARAKADALVRLMDALARFQASGRLTPAAAPARPSACYDGTGNPVGDCLDI